MAKRRLTKLIVEGIKPADKDIVVWDEALPGFGVRVKSLGFAATSSSTGTGKPAPQSA